MLVQEAYDPAWRAYENGRAVPVHIEPVMNFMLLDVPKGHHQITMRFETPLENTVGSFISGLGVAAVITLATLQKPSYKKRG